MANQKRRDILAGPAQMALTTRAGIPSRQWNTNASALPSGSAALWAIRSR